ncbi:MAG: zinc ribbon domain-containing protein [Thermanaerothrix sp.]|nr:zinc ribbon domain-containing protein [Thermanaerothrix sp.]
MNKTSPWLIVLLVIGGLLTLALTVSLIIFIGNRWDFGLYRMPMHFWGMHRWVYPPTLGWLWALLRVFTPLFLLALLVVGIVLLVRSTSPTTLSPSQPSTASSCPQCKHPIQSDWLVCPYCGTRLKDTPTAS